MRFASIFVVMAGFGYSEVPPATVIEQLQARGCALPKADRHWTRIAISGEFLRAGQQSWTILCRTNKLLSLLVLESGANPKVITVTSRAAGHLSRWSIRRIRPNILLSMQRNGNLSEPVGSFDHDGIYSWIESGDANSSANNYSAESVLFYCDNEKWLQIAGMVVN